MSGVTITNEHKRSFYVAGIKTQTTQANESSPESALIPQLWQQYFSENIEAQIPNKTPNGSILGVYWNYDADDEKSFSIIVGREVSSLHGIPKHMVGIEVPESDYLVFSQDGKMPHVIYSLWETIREYFLQNLEVKRKYSYDFESYSSDNPSGVSIYVAVES